jgi:hypothetical protein
MHEKKTSAFREGNSEGDGRKNMVVRIKHKPPKIERKPSIEEM